MTVVWNEVQRSCASQLWLCLFSWDWPCLNTRMISYLEPVSPMLPYKNCSLSWCQNLVIFDQYYLHLHDLHNRDCRRHHYHLWRETILPSIMEHSVWQSTLTFCSPTTISAEWGSLITSKYDSSSMNSTPSSSAALNNETGQANVMLFGRGLFHIKTLL